MESQHISVHGANMHYLTAGKGKTILFLHSAPGTSERWAPVILKVSKQAQCIALDLIGMGKSDSPKLEYSIEDHTLFLKGFIDTLNLEDITLVLSGWGSIVGLDYARHNEDKIKGLVFTEAYLRLEKNSQDISLYFEQLKKLESNESAKLKLMLTDAFWKTLKDNPYINPHSPVAYIIEQYSAWLQQTPIKKLLLHAGTGIITKKATITWANKTLPNLKVLDLGTGSTELLEPMADKFAEALLDWL
ncbi:MAG TPA: alpha/beta fold hydrolase [Gammaproteobacteria bacterium]|nr:alpha/beta fold hydrolase [Gammaproteobacteria bacterium]